MLSLEGAQPATLLASNWRDALYSPTLGIPPWADIVADLVDCYFITPLPLPHTICTALNPEERPLDKQRALLAITPRR